MGRKQSAAVGRGPALREPSPHNRVGGLLGPVLIFTVSTKELCTQAPGHVAGAVSRTGLQAL